MGQHRSWSGNEKGHFYDELFKGSGCGSVGRMNGSDTRDPRFESQHRPNFTSSIFNRKGENKDEEAG